MIVKYKIVINFELPQHYRQRRGFVSGVALEFRPPGTAARLFAKDKYLEPMFSDVSLARTEAQ